MGSIQRSTVGGQALKQSKAQVVHMVVWARHKRGDDIETPVTFTYYTVHTSSQNQNSSLVHSKRLSV